MLDYARADTAQQPEGVANMGNANGLEGPSAAPSLQRLPSSADYTPIEETDVRLKC